MLSIGKIIKLSDDNSYVVASKASYNGSNYYYLIDFNDVRNIKVCEANNEGGYFEEVEDDNLINSLIAIFGENLKDYLNKTDK